MKSTSVVGTWFMTMVISKLILGNVVTLLFLAPRCQKWKALNNNSSLNAHHLRREEATRSGTREIRLMCGIDLVGNCIALFA